MLYEDTSRAQKFKTTCLKFNFYKFGKLSHLFRHIALYVERTDASIRTFKNELFNDLLLLETKYLKIIANFAAENMDKKGYQLWRRQKLLHHVKSVTQKSKYPKNWSSARLQSIRQSSDSRPGVTRGHQPFWNCELLLVYRLMRRATCLIHTSEAQFTFTYFGIDIR